MKNSECIIVPNTDQRIYDGTVVILHRLPGTKWIVHNGYYTYNGRKCEGWHLSAIPSGTTMPLFENDLYMMTIVDGGSCPRPFPPCPPCPPCPPFPPGPHPGPEPEVYPFTKQDKEQIHKSMITVDSLEDLDRMSSIFLQHGKVVRVNDYEGRPEYFEWDANAQEWKLMDFGSRIIPKEELEHNLEEIDSSLEDLSGKIVEAEESISWHKLED